MRVNGAISAKRQVADVVPPGELIAWLDGRKLEAVIHLGAVSDTTATDADLVLATNFRLSLKLLDWCTETCTPFIYASSAATYGDGAAGFDDDWSLAALRRLKPMNLYGFSKHLFSISRSSIASRTARSFRRSGWDSSFSTCSAPTNITRGK
jgi:ADP-L-glycero-D-manno-heptose 6-epimerase